MATTLKSILERLPPERRSQLEDRAKELISEELSLRELHKALNQTQNRLP